ncbi:hypothetical protein J41TS4_17220 [Paenibacillus apis]|uniref:Integrase catalytic domain-containing protein n=1 Tax=Paenibacillus apis TaxID=1792174 RepID=A0A920CLS3_9BACL|nr:hypothetical protein J41TS4_17220 [Paenibacillus apis]
MDGKGRVTDNSWTERYFRSFKYECIYLNEFKNPAHCAKGLLAMSNFTIRSALINP